MLPFLSPRYEQFVFVVWMLCDVEFSFQLVSAERSIAIGAGWVAD